MSIQKKSVNFKRFKIVGDELPADFRTSVVETLRSHRFVSIDNAPEELSIGWVHFDDHRSYSFDDETSCVRDQYIALTMRVDQRKVPAKVLRPKVELALEKYLDENPTYKRVPKAVKEEITEAIKKEMLSKIFPVPTFVSAVWNTDKQELLLFNTSKAGIDRFESLFRHTFPGCRMVSVHPYSLAEGLVEGTDMHQVLQGQNMASSDAVLDHIESNAWLAEDFFLYMIDQTANSTSEYSVSTEGDCEAGEPFVSYINNKLKLAGVTDGVNQRVSVDGPQSNFAEVRAALCEGKAVKEAQLCFEKVEDAWQFKLKGAELQFASFQTPSVIVEHGDSIDEASEKQAVFYEKMHLIEKGLQLFESVFKQFLRVRLSSDWSSYRHSVSDWVAGDGAQQRVA